jgi:hypothetical protein
MFATRDRLPIQAVVAVASSAMLLFALEPFVGKVLLPLLGGAPAVWNSCVMVFQGLLLLGYWYSVGLSRVTRVRTAMLWHAGAVAISIVLWPMLVRALWAEPAAGWAPVAWIVAVTCTAVGLPFIILSSTSPLLQVWLARTSTRPLTVHRLYAASNVASVAGLIVYVAVLDPFVGLARQSLVLLIAYAVAMAVTLTFMWNRGEALPPTVAHERAETMAASRPVLRWLMMSFAASLGLYAVNTYITTDIASFPLLWCIPLAVFLLAFAFGFTRLAEGRAHMVRSVSVVLIAGALVSVVWFAEDTATWFDLGISLAGLAGLVVGLSGELARLRPADADLPWYYSVIGLGGVLAGLMSVLLLPWLWSAMPLNVMPMTGAVPEHPAALALALALIAGLSARRTGLILVGMLACVVGLAAVRERTTAAQQDYVFAARNFFGTIRVQYDAPLTAYRLWHGTTIHGVQPLERADDVGASYYGPASPIGRLLQHLAPRRVLVVGLGVGTLAAYAKSGDHYTFLEIDPLVVRIAGDDRWFSYLTSARTRGAAIEIQVGDGRLLAARLPDWHFDVIVLDAFASDSVPVHLMTVEALDLFRRKLDVSGMLVLNITNRYFDFAPVLVGAAQALRSGWALGHHDVADPYEFDSSWFVMSPLRSAAFGAGLADGTWRREGVEAMAPWTDNHATVFASLRLWNEVP